MTEVNYHLADLSEAAVQGEHHTPPTSDSSSTSVATSPAREENTGDMTGGTHAAITATRSYSERLHSQLVTTH